MKKEEDIELKILAVGDPSCGKTSFINRFVNNEFIDKIQNFKSDFKRKSLQLQKQNFVINFWDIGKVHRALDAQNKNIIIPKLFIRNSDAAIIFLDCSKKDKDFEKSLSGALRWRKFINKASDQIGNKKALKWMLVLSKSDLVYEEERELQTKKINKYLRQKSTKIEQVQYSSSKDGSNISESIGQLVFSILNDVSEEEEQKDDPIQ